MSKTGMRVNKKVREAVLRALHGITLGLASNGALAADLPVPVVGNSVSHGAATQVQQGSNLTINQLTDRATLNWQSFDIAANHSVRFNQPTANSVALNRIHQGSASKIFGNLTANGQVYLVNRNGFLFGSTASVNVGSLVASSLDISDDVHERLGLAGAINAAGGGRAALEGSGEMGRIEVAAGARITAGKQGRVILAAPEIINHGVINTPDGQAILAASEDKVYLAPSNDSSLRGLVVEVGEGGAASNFGQIVAERGNISILGLAVNQSGLVRASTSISLNGDVVLAARDRASIVPNTGGNTVDATRTGELTLGAGSVTEVIPDLTDETAVDAQPQAISTVKVVGGEVTMKSGARITARGGSVQVHATRAPGSPPQDTAADNDSQLIIESGAVIDVSGLDTAVESVTRNIVQVEARGNELRDSPLQRDGVLRGKKLDVDIRKGTDLLDISGTAANVRRSLDERLSEGGTVQLLSEGHLDVASGARVDLSGGKVTYTGGSYRTSRLITDNNSLVDISDADPNARYVGVAGDFSVRHERWGVVETFSNFAGSGGLQYEDGYVEGKDAGSLRLSGRTMAFGGDVVANTTPGRYQRGAPTEVTAGSQRPYDQRPLGAEIDLTFGTIDRDNDPSELVLQAAALAPERNEDGTLKNPGRLVLGRDFFEGGASRFSLESKGTLTLEADLGLELPEFGSLSLEAGQVSIAGDVRVKGGQLAATATNKPNVELADVDLTVAPGARLDVGGVWINDLEELNPVDPTSALAFEGGSVSLSSAGNLTLEEDSSVVADGGAWLRSDGRVVAGDGGSISLGLTGTETASRSLLLIDGTLSAYAMEHGGSLTVSANGFDIGSTRPPDEEIPDEDTPDEEMPDEDTPDEDSGILWLAPDFFQSGGFGSYTLNARRHGIRIAAGTQLLPVQQNYQLRNGFNQVATGARMETVGDRLRLPDWQRNAVNMALTSRQRIGDAAADIRIEDGAAISVEAGGHISLVSDGSIHLFGDLTAPAGEVALTLLPFGAEYIPSQKIWLGADADISAVGAARLTPDPLGFRFGEVLSGGSITMTANRGSIVLSEGSVLDVSGVSHVLDLPDYSKPGASFTPVEVDGGAGSISLMAAETILAEGALLGRASGAPGARAGSISIALDARQREDESTVLPSSPFSRGPRVIQVGETPRVSVSEAAAIPSFLNGFAFIDPAALRDGGFSQVGLTARSTTIASTTQSTAEIRFTGEVDLSPADRLVLDAPIISGEAADVSLRSAYVAMGSSDTLVRLDGTPAKVGGGTIQADPTAGTGTLQVRGDFVELIGDTSLQGFATERDDSGAAPVRVESSGDLRLRGTRVTTEFTPRLAGSFRAPGDIDFSARQIYPTTLSEFTLASEGTPDATLRIASPGGEAPGAPMSGGGMLTVRAPVIEQNGVLRAPFGSITMEGDRVALGTGSLTSISGAGLSLLFGETQLLRDLVFPLTGATRVLDTPIAKTIELQATDVDVRSGAVIDVSGGGDLIATEFVPGPGGSRDILEAGAIDGAFAIIPTLGSAYAPYDPLETPGFAGQIGETIHIAGGGGIPAGEYAVLPARYALLGGYLVTPVSGAVDVDPNRTMQASDGFPIVAGKRGFAGSGAQESRWSGYKLEPASFVRERAEYAETKIDGLFTDTGSELTRDSGSLTIEASRSLNLAGSLAQHQGAGAGPRVDIVADALTVVSQRTGDAEGVELLADELSRFGAASLLIGGTRERGEEGTNLNVSAESVRIADGANLSGREIILAAQDRIEIGENARFTASGTADQSEERLLASGDSAIASVSTRRPLILERSDTAGAAGTLSVEHGAVVSAPGSIVLDAARDSTIAGSLQSQDGSIALGAAVVTLGDAPADSDGLVLDNAALAGLRGTDLQLRSNTTVNVVGDVALDLRSFTANAAGLVGSGSGNQSITAEAISLANQNDAAGGTTTEGTGNLSMAADRVIFGEGDFRIEGYGSVAVRADGAVIGRDDGKVTIAAATEIRAPVILSESGSNTSLDVAGSLVIADTGTTPAANLAGIGSSWDISADSVSLATRVLLPSGDLRIGATGAGGITLADTASVNVAGVDLNIAGHLVGTPGGRVSLTAEQGDVRLEGRSAIDVSGASRGGEAGGISISAAQGAIQASGGTTLHANSTLDGTGSFEADAITLGDFGALNAMLNAGSFEASRAFRQREGDLILGEGQQLRAGEVSLVADQGAITIAGQIDATRATGGSVEIAAADSVTLTSSGQIVARATQAGQSGGSVLLSTTNGSITTEARADGSASIDVTGRDDDGAMSSSGYLHVSAPRIGADDVAVERFDGGVAGAGRIDIEALKVYDVSATGFVDQSVLNTIRADNQALAAGFGTVKSRLGLAGNPAVHVMSGVEIRSTGTLNTGSQLDLSDWRDGGEAGFLHLRAGEDLTVAGSISDGFRLVDMFDLINGPTQRVRLQDDHSWSYSLVAGADFSSASRRALVRDAHDLRLLSDVVVRTGTGSIDLASSGDILLSSPTSTIYTAGQNAGYGTLEDLQLDPFGIGELLPFGMLLLDFWLEGAEFGAHGGNIDIRAQGSFVGTPGNQLITDWQPRLGGFVTGTGEMPTYWAVNYDRFQQGVGALGGGDLNVRVGGDLSGVSLNVATTGKAVGDLGLDPDLLAQGQVFFNGGGDVDTVIEGGGNLTVETAGDIRGGVFYVGQGTAKMRSGGSIGAREGSTVDPILALGDATFDLQARTDLTLEAVLNPSIIHSLRAPVGEPLGGFFFSYGEDAAVRVRSLAGDIELKNPIDQITDAFNVPSVNELALGIYPGTVVAHSYGGDTRFNGQITTFPTPKGGLELLAAGDVVSDDGGLLVQSDADPDLLPSIAAPTSDVGNSAEIAAALTRFAPLDASAHAATPVHLGDSTSNLIAAGGSIGPEDSSLALYLAKQSQILAGEDIESFALRIQHNNEDDVSVLSAGGDILQPTQRTPTGNFLPELGPNARIIEISGGGRFDVMAGGTVDLGTSLGIRTVGDTTNSALAESGADITVMAGLGPTGADWSAFADKYLTSAGRFASRLASYLEAFQTDPSLTPLENFKRLPVEKQRPLALEVFFTVLRDAGSKAAETRQIEDYDPGYEAIKVLFPGENRKGDLVSLLSQIATVDGGDINLLVPGGLVNAGVASATIVVKSPEQLGIVAQRDGDINGFVRDDFIVNQSRVFALDGGDITIWSSTGDIDAGRGAKTALSVPPPRVSFDSEGNLVVEFPPAIAGSGIRGAVSTPGRPPGDVFLFAPAGVVDAGDAGIGSAGNVTIGATEVIGADNIDVGGVAVGIPVDTGGIAAGLANVSSVASSATSSATEQLGAGQAQEEQPAVLADTALSWLEVFVIGLGEENCRPDDAACLQRSQKPE